MAQNLVVSSDIRASLSAKQEEYRQRLIGKGSAWEYMHWAIAYREHRDYRDAYYKYHIAKVALDAKNPIFYEELRDVFLKDLGVEFFDGELFTRAWNVINGYCKNSQMGKEIIGGTGFLLEEAPKPPD